MTSGKFSVFIIICNYNIVFSFLIGTILIFFFFFFKPISNSLVRLIRKLIAAGLEVGTNKFGKTKPLFLSKIREEKNFKN